MSRAKKIGFISITSSIISLAPLVTTISCSKSETNNPPIENNSFTNIVNNWFTNGDLVFKLNNQEQPDISYKYFEIYKNDFSTISQLFILENKTQEELNWKITSLDYYEGKIFYTLIISNSQNETATIENSIRYNFSTNDNYYRLVIRKIEEKIKFKDEYVNQKLIKLFEESNSNDEFIDNFLDTEYLNYYIGIQAKLTIPTQTINNIYSSTTNSTMRFQVVLIDAHNNQIIDYKGNNLISMSLDNANVSPITIFNHNDLSLTSIENLQGISYFGKLFIRTQGREISEKIIIKYNFENKNIIGDLDFSNFLNLEFSETCKFSLNSITRLKFNPNATIRFLSNQTFYSNFIQEVNLPQKIYGYENTTFDSSVQIYGIESIDQIDSLIDSSNNLDLSRIDDFKTLEETLKTINQVQKKRETLTFNKVFLPPYLSSSIALPKITCNEIVFYDFSKENKTSSFDLNISNWKINNDIRIPNYIVKIDKKYLPSNVKITREFNSKTLELINDKKLYLSNKFNFINPTNEEINITLIDSNNLDSYFWSFDNDLENSIIVEEIIISQSIVSTLYSSNWNFFIQNSIKEKKIIFNSSVEQINVSQYNNLTNLNLIIKRENHLSKEILSNNKILNLSKLYEEYPLQIKQKSINQLLIGLHEYIQEIDLANLTKIEQWTFAELTSFENITLDLSSIKEVAEYAFYNSSINLEASNFIPISISSNSFYKSQLQGKLDLSQISTTSIPTYAFAYTKITEVILNSNIITISPSAFYYCSELTSINLENVENIGSSAFYSTKLTYIDLTKATSIGASAFKNISTLEQIINFDISNFNISSIFIDSITKKISFNLSLEQIYKNINYNQETKVLDLSSFKSSDVILLNNLNILFQNINPNFASITNPLSELILPSSETNLNTDFLNLFVNKYVDKLTWNAEGANAKTLNSKIKQIKFKELDSKFLIGVSEIPASFFANIELKNNELDLRTIEKINDRAFYGSNVKKFINTEDVREIGANAFNSDVEFIIGTNVKLKDNSFTSLNIINNPNSKITRSKIFSDNSIYNEIYSINSDNEKILDFTKASRFDKNTPWIITKLNDYKNISEYLLDGDVDVLILPNSYIISDNLYNNLGTIKSIVFQYQNEQIVSGAFTGTNIIQKPSKSETNIILDQDNFWNED